MEGPEWTEEMERRQERGKKRKTKSIKDYYSSEN